MKPQTMSLAYAKKLIKRYRDKYEACKAEKVLLERELRDTREWLDMAMERLIGRVKA